MPVFPPPQGLGVVLIMCDVAFHKPLLLLWCCFIGHGSELSWRYPDRNPEILFIYAGFGRGNAAHLEGAQRSKITFFAPFPSGCSPVAGRILLANDRCTAFSPDFLASHRADGWGWVWPGAVEKSRKRGQTCPNSLIILVLVHGARTNHTGSTALGPPFSGGQPQEPRPTIVFC